MNARSQFEVTLLSLLVWTSACDRDEARPYTPFGVASTSTPPDSSPAASASATDSPAPAFQKQKATYVTPPQQQVDLSGVHIVAPDGLLVAAVLPWKRDDGPPSALGWLVDATEPGKSAGALYHFHAGEVPRRIVASPTFVPTLAGCSSKASLERTGPSTVTVDVAADCPDAGLPTRAPVRSLQIVAPDRAEPVLQSLRLAAPRSEESLEIASDTSDLDGDGHDDVSLNFTLHVGTTPEATAKLIWLNRASGPSRDFSEPRKSFADIGSVEVVRSKGSTTSEAVPGRIDNARRLMTFLCKENGTPSLTDARGAAIECGDLNQAKDFYTRAMIVAQLTRGLIGEALLVAESASWYQEDPKESRFDEVEKQVTKRTAAKRVLAIRPRDPGPNASFSPLAFAADGRLLALTADGVMRLEDDVWASANDEIDPWPLVPKGPRGEVLIGLMLPCERPLLEVNARSDGGEFLVAATGRWLSPRPGVCAGDNRLWMPELRPVRYGQSGFSGLIGSAWLGSENALEAPMMGSPVSANGKHWVARSTRGLFVQHETDAELWKVDEPTVEHCVIDDTGSKVACVVGKGAALFAPAAAP